MFNFIRNEKGQSMVEFAVVIPIFLLLLFFLIELGWLTYQKVLFDYTCRNIAWDLNLGMSEDRVMNSGRPYYFNERNSNRLLKDEFDKNAQGTHIDKRKVSITDGSIAVYPGKKTYKHKGGSAGTGDVVFKATAFEIQCKIQYKFEFLTPIIKPFFGKDIMLTSDLYKARRGNMRTN